MNTVEQPSALPTNKLMVAAAIGPAATEVWGALMPSAFAGPEMSYLVGLLISLSVGYVVKDRPNVLVE